MVISVFAQPTQAFNEAYDASRARSRNQLATQRANRLAQDIEDPVMREVLGGLSGQEGLAAIGQYEQTQRAAQAEAARLAEEQQYERGQANLEAQREGLEKFGEFMGQVGQSLRSADEAQVPQMLEAAARQANILADSYGIADLVATEDPNEFYQGAMLFAGHANGDFQLRQGIDEETGNPVYFAIDPNTQESINTGVRAPDSGSSDVEAIMNSLPAFLGATHTRQLIRDEFTKASEGLSAANDLLDYVADIERTMEEIGPGSSGLLGTLRGTGQGIIEQLSQIPGAGGFSQYVTQAQEAYDNPEQFFEDPAVAEEFFSPQIAAQDYLVNSLAFAIARSRDPGGRLSDAEVRNAAQSLGQGLFSSDSQRRATLEQVRREAERRAERSSATLDRILNANPSLDAAASRPDPNRRPGVRPDPQPGAQSERPPIPGPDATIEELTQYWLTYGED